MRTTRRQSLVLLASLLALTLACNLPFQMGAGPDTANLVQTSVAQTVAAQVSQVTLVLPTVSLPTIQPTGTLPPSPTVEGTATATATPTTPMISVSVDTNCRYGPGPDYHIVGALLVGQTVEVKGKYAHGDWWYIDNPRRAGEFCWVWGQYAQVTGNKDAVAAVTPPPVYFVASYVGHADCEGLGGVETFIFSVKNIGSVALESASATVVKKSNGDSLMHADYPFANRNAPFRSTNCGGGASALTPGATALITVIAQTPAEATEARVTIRLCTQDGLGGACIERTVDFTI